MSRNKFAAVLTNQNLNIRKTAGFLTVMFIENILEVRHHYNRNERNKILQMNAK